MGSEHWAGLAMGVLESLGNHRLVMPFLTMLVAWWCFLDVSWTFQTSATEPKIDFGDTPGLNSG